MNLRPVAAAIALPKLNVEHLLQFLAAAACLEESFTLHGFGSSGKLFCMDQNPRNAVARRF